MTDSMADLVRRNEREVLKALGAISQTRVAELAGITDTMLSRMLSPRDAQDRSDLQKWCAVIAACNLVLLPRTFSSIDPDELRATRLLARKMLEQETKDSGWGALP